MRAELKRTPLWVIVRHDLEVRGLDFHLYYPTPRSGASTAAAGYPKNRITFRPRFYYGETNTEIDFVFFLNGLPIVALELKHEKNQTVTPISPELVQPATRSDAASQEVRSSAFRTFSPPNVP